MTNRLPHVLIIDDDEPFGTALSTWLVELGFQATIATTASHGVSLLKQTDCDVLLLELELPDIHGLAVLRQLEREGHRTPVVVMSGSAETEDVVQVWRQNAVDFLSKPFQIEELHSLGHSCQQRCPNECSSASPARRRVGVRSRPSPGPACRPKYHLAPHRGPSAH
jgi:two-component system response regulator AtoC